MRCLGVKGGSGENFAQSERGCDPGLANVDNVDNGGLGGLDFLTLGTSQEGGVWRQGAARHKTHNCQNCFLCNTHKSQQLGRPGTNHQVNYLVRNWENYRAKFVLMIPTKIQGTKGELLLDTVCMINDQYWCVTG